MGVYGNGIDRDKMAVELYFSVLRLKKASGLTHKEAKALACDAVELRYNISPKRLQNIIYDNHETLTCDRGLFLEDNRRLIETLKEANDTTQKLLDDNRVLIETLKGMQDFIDRNNELLKILEDVNHV